MRRAMCIAAAVLALAGAGAGSAQAEISRGPAVAAPSAQAPDPGRATLLPGTQLCTASGGRTSTNLRTVLIMQTDGNLVVWKDGRAVWQTGTANRGFCAIFQSDGNLAVIDHANRPIWASNTANRGQYLAIQNDGNVVIYNSTWQPVWDTQTSG